MRKNRCAHCGEESQKLLLDKETCQACFRLEATEKVLLDEAKAAAKDKAIRHVKRQADFFADVTDIMTRPGLEVVGVDTSEGPNGEIVVSIRAKPSSH